MHACAHLQCVNVESGKRDTWPAVNSYYLSAHTSCSTHVPPSHPGPRTRTLRRGAVIESRAEISRNASRRRSLSSEITAKKEMDPVAEVAEVLRQMGNAQQSTRAVQQMKPHVAGPLRQPVTPPSSPARGGFRTTNNKRSVDVPSVREKDEWAYVEDFDGFVGADAHALKVC